MENYTATLTSNKGHNGKWRDWTGEAVDWDDACEKAEAANPGWSVYACGTAA